MPPDITDTQLQELIDQNLSQNEISRRTGIPRSTLRRRLQTLSKPQVNLGVPQASHEGAQAAYTGTPEGVPFSAELAASRDDLQDMIAWWRQRKRVLETDADTGQETQRQTYHVQKRYIAAIKRASDIERVSIAEIVNRAFKQFFDRSH